MSALNRQAKEIIETFCRSSRVPTILLNKDLICVLSNDESFYPVGIHFNSVLANNMDFVVGETAKAMVMVKDKYCCAIITPVADEYFICQMYDADDIFQMAQFSGIYDETLPMISSNGIQLGAIEDELKELLTYDIIKDDHKIDLKLLELTAKTCKARGRFEELLTYYEISFSKNNKNVVFCLYNYVKWAVDKCNSLLLNTGRCIELNCPDKETPVSADSRHAIFSFIELIQFVLLHSPTDVDPFISLEKSSGSVVFMITCRGVIFVPKGTENEFIGAYSSGGLSIVRRFAQRCGAEFEFINENNNVIGFRIFFPKINAEKTEKLVFQTDNIVDYDDRYSRYAEYKMQRVIDAYNMQSSKNK